MRINPALIPRMTLVALFLLNLNGVASARAFRKPVMYQAGGRPNAIAVADFNSDGNLDLAVANGNTSDVSILLGNGDGSFQPPTNYQVGGDPFGITLSCETLADRSQIDLAVTNAITNDVHVLVGNGDGTFQPAVNYSVGTGISPLGIVGSVDFNGDGNCDLAAANASHYTNYDGNIAIFLGNGDGTFQPAVNYDTLGSQARDIASGDFNGDGSPDLAVTNTWSPFITIFLNNGSGDFTASTSSVGTTPWTIAVYDGTSLVVSLFTGTGGKLSLLHGNGDGTFEDIRNFPVGTAPWAITQGFLNGDSTPDIAIADLNLDAVFVLLGRPSPRLGFRRPAEFGVCAVPNALVAFDFNHDNKTDLAVACDNGVGVMLNTGP